MKEHYRNPVKKMIPSRLETGFQQLLYRTVGPHIPKTMTPNQMTAVSAAGGAFAILMTLLSNISPVFLIGTIIGIAVHLIADDLDGYIARSRDMASKAGAYFDLITDVLFSTFLLLAFGLTPYAHMAPAAFAAPLYGIMNVTMMNYIIYFNEFLFPRLGPIEAHIAYAVFALLAMLLGGDPLLTVFGAEVTACDILLVVGMLPMYYEMLRMAVRLFRRLQASQL